MRNNIRIKVKNKINNKKKKINNQQICSRKRKSLNENNMIKDKYLRLSNRK